MTASGSPPVAPARAYAQDLDAADPLAPFRERFAIGDPDVIYLCGNSLGRQPRAAVEHIERAMQEWAKELVEGWQHWLDLPTHVGDLMAGPILGAGPGQVIVSDSTSVNLYKLAMAARTAVPGRPVVVTDAGEFPTDRYVLEGLGDRRLITSDPVAGPTVDDVTQALDDHVGVVCLSQVGYRSSALADMADITAAVHDAGALMLWDLSHSAGCFPVALDRHGVDLAVGCTYKYLCAGPGAPAFLFVRTEVQDRLRQPIWGWFGQRDQFAMGERYDPAPDARQFLVGTPSVIGLAGVQAGVEVVAEAGVAAIRGKALTLGALGVQLHRAWLAGRGFSLGSPPEGVHRGSHLSLCHADAQRIHAELAGSGRVITDFRFPNTIRLGLAPLTTRFVDVWDAFDRLRALSY
ncbi:MAG: kynureninase [Acidimicrobiaceae bacterium]|nr:kynureninase [Acidimicrobiaceae bacterium]